MHTVATAATRLLLVAQPERPTSVSPRVRRYRLARVRIEGRQHGPGGDRWAHLKRVYD